MEGNTQGKPKTSLYQDRSERDFNPDRQKANEAVLSSRLNASSTSDRYWDPGHTGKVISSNSTWEGGLQPWSLYFVHESRPEGEEHLCEDSSCTGDSPVASLPAWFHRKRALAS